MDNPTHILRVGPSSQHFKKHKVYKLVNNHNIAIINQKGQYHRLAQADEPSLWMLLRHYATVAPKERRHFTGYQQHTAYEAYEDNDKRVYIVNDKGQAEPYSSNSALMSSFVPNEINETLKDRANAYREYADKVIAEFYTPSDNLIDRAKDYIAKNRQETPEMAANEVATQTEIKQTTLINGEDCDNLPASTLIDYIRLEQKLIQDLQGIHHSTYVTTQIDEANARIAELTKILDTK